MNVYDFDKTIFKIDSTAGLVKYLFVHEPRTLLSIPRTVMFGIGYGLHIVKKLTFKTNLYHMFTFVKDMDAVVDAYVEDSMQYVQKWYLEQQKADDVIISASPEFLIKRFAKKMGVQYVMASKVDPYSGAYDGLNCHGKEKVTRFYAMFPEGHVDGFWSDSLTDTPLARIADHAYLVKGAKMTKWPEEVLEKEGKSR